ncbi:MAG: cyclic nucleotide-binding domain-containing protein [Bryobacteraceae bacterium]|nr:cyclic nucleotide-binding domain-containing protein [Bryobacteraceae bacterium]
MKTAVIRHRVADFLKSHAPFDSLNNEDLLALAGSGRVKFHESEEDLFSAGDAVGAQVWVIQQGRVEMWEADQRRDVLGAGDLLGLEGVAGLDRYTYTARTSTDVILYAVDASLFESMVARYDDVSRYLAAHFSLSSVAGVGRTSWLDAAAPPGSFLQARFGVTLPMTTREAVRQMLAQDTEELMHEGRVALTADVLAMFCHRNPARLLREIRQAGSAEEMIPLLDLATRMVMEAMAHATDVDDGARIGAAVVSAMAECAVRLAEEGLDHFERPALPSGWLTFGAAARYDLIRPRWPNMAAVYDDSADATPDAGVFFTMWNGQADSWLHRFGLMETAAVWPPGTHPCMPLSAWKSFFTETIARPLGHDLYARREFFDLRTMAGDPRVLHHLQSHIGDELGKPNALVPLLANDTLSHLPPMTFFGGLVLELDGGERPAFDVTETALTPIADAARVFALGRRRLEVTNTLDRLASAAADFPAHARLFEESAEAFRIALYHQTLAGGPRIDPSRLGRYDSRLLKTAFGSIQRLLELTHTIFVAGA